MLKSWKNRPAASETGSLRPKVRFRCERCGAPGRLHARIVCVWRLPCPSTLKLAVRLSRVLSATLALVTLLSLRAAGQTDIPLSLERLALKGVVAESVRHQDRQAIRLMESDSSRNTLGLAVVRDLTFRDGTIELDVAGRRGPYATPDDRGFIGIAFRVTPTADRFEYIYLRPDNGRASDQVRRNHSTQYAAHPDFPWPRLRKEFPEKYESYVDLEPGVWTRMRVVVSGATAQLFVHDAMQPTLVVSDLKLGVSEGSVALWIGAGTEGFFSNLRIRQ